MKLRGCAVVPVWRELFRPSVVGFSGFLLTVLLAPLAIVAYVWDRNAFSKKIAPAMGSISDRIRKLRLSRGAQTQAEFAALLGVTRGAVGNWELGKGVKRENLMLIAEKTGAPIDWLLTGKGDFPTNSPASHAPSEARRNHGLDPEAVLDALEALLISLPLDLSPDAAKRLSKAAMSLALTPPDRSIALSYPEQTRLRAQFLARQFGFE
jgi:transcriptional regulator with XRE-family HTH domain